MRIIYRFCKKSGDPESPLKRRKLEPAPDHHQDKLVGISLTRSAMGSGSFGSSLSSKQGELPESCSCRKSSLSCAAHPGQRRRTAKLTMPPSCTASRPAQGGTQPVGQTLGWWSDPSSLWRRRGSESCTRLTLGEHPLSPLPTVKVLGHK